MNKKFKKVIRTFHLWLGLLTGLVVLVISVTGCLYVFEEEIREWMGKDYLYVPGQSKPFVGLATILNEIHRVAPQAEITSIRIFDEIPNATVQLRGATKEVYYFNPYNGHLVKELGQDWLATVQLIHTSLLLGDFGKTLIGTCVIIFVFLLISGWILWFPAQIRLLKQSLTVKWKASFKRLNYDLHNVLGFYASWILMVIACSGLYFAFDNMRGMVSFLTGSHLSEGKEMVVSNNSIDEPRDLRYDRIYKELSKQYPGAMSTSFSIRKTGELRVRLLYPYVWTRIQHTFYYDGVSGQLLRAKLYGDFNRADQIEATNYDLHTGRLFGLFGKIIACLVSLISASLPITGFIIWWKKRTKSKKKKAPASTPRRKTVQSLVQGI